MKKILFVVVVLVMAFAFAAGNVYLWPEEREVENMTISFGGGGDLPQNQYEAVLNVVSSYEYRTLALDYSKVYYRRTEETEEDDFVGEGVLGGEFFDRFEEVVSVLDSDLKAVWDDYEEECMEGGGIDVSVSYLDGDKEEFHLGHCYQFKSDEQVVMDFFDDVVELLESNVY